MHPHLPVPLRAQAFPQALTASLPAFSSHPHSQQFSFYSFVVQALAWHLAIGSVSTTPMQPKGWTTNEVIHGQTWISAQKENCYHPRQLTCMMARLVYYNSSVCQFIKVISNQTHPCHLRLRDGVLSSGFRSGLCAPAAIYTSWYHRLPWPADRVRPSACFA
jgi:hypothetical protein